MVKLLGRGRVARERELAMKPLLERMGALGIAFLSGMPGDAHPSASSFAFGPAGGACDIATREVWMGELEPFQVLHEAMHVLLAVPGIPLETQPEECKFLIPIEREYGKVLLSSKGLADCIDWQEATGCEWKGTQGELHYLDGYETKHFWRRALRLGVELGVLDDDHRPTFAWPAWEALAPGDDRFLRSRHETSERAQRQTARLMRRLYGRPRHRAGG